MGGFLYIASDDGSSYFRQYPLSQFHASTTKCDINISNATATQSDIQGIITDDNKTLTQWNLHFDIQRTWNNTMGLLTNTPSLPINWHVSALNAKVTGTIVFNGVSYHFDDEPAYSDHNWGITFPSSWIWIHANNFIGDTTESISIAGGFMSLPFIGTEAYMLVYQYKNKLYEFRSQDLNVIFDIYIDKEHGYVSVIAIKGLLKLELKTNINISDFHEYLVPTKDGMTLGSLQAMKGNFEVLLYKKNSSQWNLIRDSFTDMGTLELGGSYGGF